LDFKPAFLLLLLSSDLVKPPSAIPRDSGTVIVSSKSGERRWSANWTMEPVERGGRKAVRFTERGEGRISPFPGEVRWLLESVWSAEAGFQPLDSEKIVTTPAGAAVVTERKHFDAVNGSLKFERQRPADKREEKSITAPRDTLIPEGIAGILRYLMFENASPFPAHLLSNEPKLYSVTFEGRGKERVRTTAGDVECYKIEMVPHLGVLSFARHFFPKVYFWFTVASPHSWVRYEGPENGPGTPEVVMQLQR
jgi:hypothetical protein